MKNYLFKLLSITFFTSILSGCGLVKSAANLTLAVATLPVAIVDSVTGTHMNRSIHNGIKELQRPGKKMDKQSVEKAVSGKTFYALGSVAYLNANGESISQREKDTRINKYKWSVEDDGTVCIAKDSCYEMRKKDKTLYYGNYDEPLTLKNGDAENLTGQFDAAKKQETEKLAEIERKKAAQERAKAEEAERQRITDPMYETASKLVEALKCNDALKLDRQAQSQDGKEHSADDKSNGYRISFSSCQAAIVEAKCMATPKCRAKKEREEQQRQAERQREKEQRCAHVYVGKTFGDHIFKKEVIGFSVATGKVTTRNILDGHRREMDCSDVPE